MKRLLSLFITMFLLLGFTHSAKAALHDRGAGLIYDDILDITWMGNANYGGITMNWDNAINWAESLDYQDFQDWRLPATDISCTGKSCTDSEMGHLFESSGITYESPGQFTDVKNFMYWSGNEDPDDSTNAWRFSFKYGSQDISSKDLKRYAWAVRDGDTILPAVAPEPVSSALFLTGGIIMAAKGFLRRRNKIE